MLANMIPPPSLPHQPAPLPDLLLPHPDLLPHPEMLPHPDQFNLPVQRYGPGPPQPQHGGPPPPHQHGGPPPPQQNGGLQPPFQPSYNSYNPDQRSFDRNGAHRRDERGSGGRGWDYRRGGGGAREYRDWQDNRDDSSRRPRRTGPRPCAFFNTRQGCRDGDQCRFMHETGLVVPFPGEHRDRWDQEPIRGDKVKGDEKMEQGQENTSPSVTS